MTASPIMTEQYKQNDNDIKQTAVTQ